MSGFFNQLLYVIPGFGVLMAIVSVHWGIRNIVAMLQLQRSRARLLSLCLHVLICMGALPVVALMASRHNDDPYREAYGLDPAAIPLAFVVTYFIFPHIWKSIVTDLRS